MALLWAGLAALLAGTLYQRWGAARNRRQFPPPGSMVDVGGHFLHVVCSGAGTPMVLFEAGIAASSLSWTIVQPAVAAFTRTCAYDRAGLAWSDAPSHPRTFTRIVDELSTLVDRLGGDRVILVGHSFGCFVVRSYAARAADRIAGLVLVDPATEWLRMTRGRARLIRGGRQLSRIGSLLAHIGVVRACLALLTGGAPGAPRRFVRVFGPTAAATLERLVGEVRKLPADVHPAVQSHWCQPKCFHAMFDHLLTLERDHAALAAADPPRHVPVVVISSGHQPAEERAAHQDLVHASERGRHIVAARSAHWVQFDEPDLIVAAVRELVEMDRAASGDQALDGRVSAVGRGRR
jgi:pimeloyl-ACP methyl ester carboxylesterase